MLDDYMFVSTSQRDQCDRAHGRQVRRWIFLHDLSHRKGTKIAKLAQAKKYLSQETRG